MPQRQLFVALLTFFMAAMPSTPTMPRASTTTRLLDGHIARSMSTPAADFHTFATHVVNAMLACDRANQEGMTFFTTTRDKAILNSAVGLTLILRAQSACNDAQYAIVRVAEPVSLAHFTLDATPHLTLHQLHFLAFSWAFDTTTFWQDAQKVWEGNSSSPIEKDVAKQYQNANDAALLFVLGLAVGASQLHASLPTIPSQIKSGSRKPISAQNFKRTSSTRHAAATTRAPKSESLYDTVPLATADAIMRLVRPFDLAGRLKASVRIANQASGSCTSASYATERSDAYRCFAGSTIVDPCFTDQYQRTRQLVCMDSPLNQNVTLLTLQGGLPQPSSVSIGLGQPWALTLATGETCEILGGATLAIGTLRLNYGCSSRVSVYGAVDKGRAHWTVLVWRGRESVTPRLNQLQRVRVKVVYF